MTKNSFVVEVTFKNAPKFLDPPPPLQKGRGGGEDTMSFEGTSYIHSDPNGMKSKVSQMGWLVGVDNSGKMIKGKPWRVFQISNHIPF